MLFILTLIWWANLILVRFVSVYEFMCVSKSRAFVRINIKPSKNECVNISIYQMKDHFTSDEKNYVKKNWKRNTISSILLSVKNWKGRRDQEKNQWQKQHHCTNTHFMNLFKFICGPNGWKDFYSMVKCVVCINLGKQAEKSCFSFFFKREKYNDDRRQSVETKFWFQWFSTIWATSHSIGSILMNIQNVFI